MTSTADTEARRDAVACWHTVLDELECLLDTQAQCLDGAANGRPLAEIPPAFVVPGHLGAMPAAVRARATALKVRTDELTTRARQIEQSMQLTQQASPRRSARLRATRASFDEKF